MAEKYHAKHHIKSTAPKALAIALAAVIGVGGAGAAAVAYAQSAKSAPAQKAADVLQSHTASNKKTENTKTETVYVIANADGTVKKVLVSDWIQNALGSSSVTDRSELSDVSVVKGDTTYTMNGDDLRVWDAQGGDVYTQGTIEKELPVNLAVSYQLDGKPISAEELAGKSGRVTIRFDYANNQYETRTVNGKNEKIYVPFVMLTGLLLDNDSFSNIEISNGKLVNDGSRTVAIGFAMPGLQENLGIDRSDLELPDYVEVSADVTNFSLATTMTFATNDLFNQVDVDEMNGADDLKDAMTQLTDAMTQLTDGSSQLYDGLSTLLDKSGTLISGINTLTDGAKALRDGANQAASGAQQLQAGIDEYAAQLNNALAQMSGGVGDVQNGLSQVLAGFEEIQGKDGANNKALVAAAEQVYDQLLNTAVTQLQQAGLTVPEADHTTAATLTSTLDALTQKPYTQLTTLVTQAAVKKTITEQVLAAMQQIGLKTADGKAMTMEQYEAAKTSELLPAAQTQQIDAAIAAKLADKATVTAVTQAIAQNAQAQATIAATVTQYVTTLSTVNAQLKAYDEFYTGLQAYTAGVAEAADGTQQIADGANTLHSAMTSGASQLASGTQQLRDGASQLTSGTGALATGASQLFDGLLTLQSGSGALVDGVEQLRDGAMQLSDGLKQFNDEGIAPIEELVNGDLDSLIARLKATADVSKNYRSFAGLSDDMDGKVSFIYKTAEIEANK